MSEQIYVAVYQSQKFGDDQSCSTSYVGTLKQIVSAMENDDEYKCNYDFYTLGVDKLKLVTEYSVERVV